MYDDLRLEHSSTVERVADELRRAFFEGRIATGAPLREVALSTAMRVGRSTIREALGLLVADGLAVRIPNRGVVVKQLSESDVRDVSFARRALESAGVRRWTSASEDQRAAVHDALARYALLASHSKDPAALTEAHLRIHGALVGLTGSERLVSAAEAYSAELRLGLAHLDRVRGNIREQVDDHRRLVELLESGDLEAAAAELDRHLTAAEFSLHSAIEHDTIDT